MTLILKLDLDIVKMYHHTKNEVSMSTGSKVIAQTGTHTHTHYENITCTAYAEVKRRKVKNSYGQEVWTDCPRH